MENFTGGSAADTIDVQPIAGATRTITGNNPTSTPGDTLVFDAMDAAVEDTGSVLRATGYGDVNYNTIETINIINADGNQGTVTGTDNVDGLELWAIDADSVKYQLTTGATAGPVVTLDGIGSFQFNAAAGDDTMLVHSDAKSLPTGGIGYDGEGQSTGGDMLRVDGGGADTATYAPGATDGSGTITTSTFSGSNDKITFTGLEPVDITGMTTATLSLPGGGSTVGLTAGDSVTGFTTTDKAIRVSGSYGVTPTAFETVAFRNNGNVVINTTGLGSPGADAVTISGTWTTAHANTNLSIDTGTGSDTVSIQGDLVLPAGGVLSIATDAIQFADGSLTVAAGTVNLNATGSISDADTTDEVDVTAATLNATANSGVEVDTHIAYVSVSSVGAAVSINEHDGLEIRAVAAGTLALVANGVISDADDTTIAVSGLATLDAGANAIMLGNHVDDETDFGSLNVTGGVVTISEDSATELAGVSAASLTLSSAGPISDVTGTTITVTGLATLVADNGTVKQEITLGDDTGDATGFGSLNVTGDAVTITEDSGTVLRGVSAASLTLSSAGPISDAAGTTIAVSGLATLVADDGTDKQEITLGGDVADSTNFGTLNVTGAAVTITEDSDTALTGVSATSLTLSSAGPISDAAGTTIAVSGLATLVADNGTVKQEITLGDDGSDATGFGSLNVTGGAVTITEDSGTELTGVSAASLTLSSAGPISDAAGTTIAVSGLATLVADNGTVKQEITLGDDGSDTTNFSSLNVTGSTVTITEDSGTVLTGVSAASLTLSSAGPISDAAGTTIEVSGLATLVADNGTVKQEITLGDDTGDATGFGSLNVTGAAVTITEDSGTELTGVAASTFTLTSAGEITDADDTTIAVSGLATLNAGANAITLGNHTDDETDFGSLNVTGGAVTISEDSDTQLAGTSTVASLDLDSAGAIGDDVDDATADVVADSITLTAATGIGVASGSLDVDVNTVTLASSATGGVNLNLVDPDDSGVTATSITATTSGDVTVQSTQGGNIFTFESVTAANGVIDISAVEGNVTARDVSTAATTGKTISITVNQTDGLFTHDSGQIQSDSGLITLKADNMTLSGGTIASGAADVRLRPNDADQKIAIGSGASDDTSTLGLTADELNIITTSTTDAIVVGESTVDGTISVVGALNLTAGGSSNLSLETGSTSTVANGEAINDGTTGLGGNLITGTNLTFSAAGGIDVTIDADLVAAESTDAGDIRIDEAGAVSIGAFHGVSGISTTDSNVTLVAEQTVTFIEDISAGSSGSVEVTSNSGQINDDTDDGNADITTTGSVSISAATGIGVSGGSLDLDVATLASATSATGGGESEPA